MGIQVGDRLPARCSYRSRSRAVSRASRPKDLFAGKKVVLFAVPGAFTPTCSLKHLPGFIEKAAEIRKGIDSIICLAVNDAFVMDAWAKERGAGDAVIMLADGSAEFTKAVGLELDGSRLGLGLRSQRYAAIIEDGVVKSLHVEEPRQLG